MINRNYSLLVLIILILFITYINIPNSLSMKGGSDNNPYDSMTPEDLDKNLMKHSSVYNLLNNNIGFYVYVGVLILLLIISIYYFNLQIQVQGIPNVANPVISWDNEGSTFLTQFFILDKKSKGINAPGSDAIKPETVANFSNDTIDFASKMKSGIDLFCNIVAPCNICSCTGPDPNYGGDSRDAPIVPYDGPGCKPAATLEIPVEKFSEGLNDKAPKIVPNPGNSVKKTAEKLGLEHRIMPGTIPNCCCHLFKTIGITLGTGTRSTDITPEIALTITNLGKDADDKPIDVLPDALKIITEKSNIDDIKNNSISNTKWPLGLPKEVGCEPNERPAPLEDATGAPKTPNNGLYAFAMLQSCLSTKPISYGSKPIKDDQGNEEELDDVPDLTKPNDGKTPYSINTTACNDPKMIEQLVNERGYSKNSLYRNNEFFNALKAVISNAAKGTPSTSFELKKHIGNLPVPPMDTSYPWVDLVNKSAPGPNWPDAHPAFGPGDFVTTEWFYIKDSKKYELKIDNYLKEVYAFPLRKDATKNSNATREILPANPGFDAAKAFLDAGLDAKIMKNNKEVPKYLELRKNRSSIYHGAYIFP